MSITCPPGGRDDVEIKGALLDEIVSALEQQGTIGIAFTAGSLEKVRRDLDNIGKLSLLNGNGTYQKANRVYDVFMI